MDASTEFNKEQTIPDNKITTIINIKFSVALYVITPSVAEKMRCRTQADIKRT